MEMLSCRDCLNCKAILSAGILKCNQGYWVTDAGKPKTIILDNTEIREVVLKKRKLFELANNCHGFLSMEDQ